MVSETSDDLFAPDAFRAAPDVVEPPTRRSRKETNPAREAADRVRLLLSIPPYLMRKKRVSVAQLAKDFKITVSTADELVRIMAVSGLPGRDGSYMPFDLFDIDWDAFLNNRVIEVTNHVELRRAPRLTSREAATLIAGLQYIEALAAPADRRAVRVLRDKLARGARNVNPGTIRVEPPPMPPLIDLVRDAVEAQTQLEVVYQNADGKRTPRVIEPIRIDLASSAWYVRAFCHTRRDVLTFRIDRIVEAKKTRRRRTSSVHADDLDDRLFDPPHSGLFDVVLDVQTNTARLITEFSPQILAGAPAGFVRAGVKIGSLRNLARVVASYPGSIRVISPPEAVAAVKGWASEALAAYPKKAKPSTRRGG